jgi:hypothetical protein
MYGSWEIRAGPRVAPASSSDPAPSSRVSNVAGMDMLERLFGPPAPDSEPELDARDVGAILGTPGVRRDVRAAARLAASLSPTEKRRAAARATDRLREQEPPTRRARVKRGRRRIVLGAPRPQPRRAPAGDLIGIP